MSPTPDLTRRPRTKRVFAEADMMRLRDLYYDCSVPLPRVGDAFGVPVSTLLRWIAEMDWPRRSAQASVSARADLFTQVEAQRQVEPPARRRKPAPAPSRSALVRDVAIAARKELDALAADPGPDTPEERRRRAGVIDMLSRALARMERIDKAELDAFKDLDRAMASFARSVKPKPEPKPTRWRPGPSPIRPYGQNGRDGW